MTEIGVADTGIGVAVTAHIRNVTQEFEFPILARMWLREFGILTSEHSLKVMDPSGESLEVPPLKVANLRINTAILGPSEVGQRNEQLPWIWSFGTSTNQDGTWMDDCK